jgi:predicted RNA-binding protein YlxR (DUF448 family)
MANKKKPLDDDEIVTKINQKVKDFVGWRESKLSTELQRVTDYYNGTLPARQSKGRSSYVSTDVYDAVEAMKSQLLETFAGNPDSLVTFPAQNEEDVETARVATAYCSYVVFRQNKGYDIFNDAIHDGLTARVGITKVFWDKKTDYVDEEINGAAYEDLQGLIANEEEVDSLDADLDEDTGTFNGTMTRKVDKSQVRLLSVPAEEFLVASRTKCLDDADCSHRTLKTKSELIDDMGYDKDKVNSVSYEGSSVETELSPESLARFAPINGASKDESDDPLQPELDKVLLFETYVHMDIKDGKGVRLWKICHAGKVLFSKEEVDRHPFKAFVPLPVPHVFWGNNFAARVIPTQNSRTVLTRAILDHASVTTNPRWGVVKGGLTNPKEMLDNRLGGVVNMTRPDAVKPFEQHNLNPFVFQTLEMLKANKEESTGISSLSQGLNKDAISTQNSGALVDNLVTLSQQRQKIIARNFANGYLVPLYIEVYRLVLENEQHAKIVELAGEFQQIDPARWVERLDCKVALKLGYGEREREAAKYGSLYTALAGDAGLGPMFTPENRYKLLTDGMKADSFENYADYITDPKKVQPPPPDPIKMKELEIADKKAQAALITAQATAGSKQAEASLDQMRLHMEEMLGQLKAVLDVRDADRKDADIANKIDVAQRETAMLEKAPPAENGANPIISPNG